MSRKFARNESQEYLMEERRIMREYESVVHHTRIRTDRAWLNECLVAAEVAERELAALAARFANPEAQSSRCLEKAKPGIRAVAEARLYSALDDLNPHIAEVLSMHG